MKNLSALLREAADRIDACERLVRVDPLTETYNLRGVEELFDREMRRHNAFQRPLSIFVVDIDEFKQVNQQYLHTGGNKALITVARSIKAVLSKTDQLGRPGGDEFAVIAPETDEARAIRLAERIRQSVMEAVTVYNGKDIRVTVSVGGCVAAADQPTTCETMLDLASRAVLMAKQESEGKNHEVILGIPR